MVLAEVSWVWNDRINISDSDSDSDSIDTMVCDSVQSQTYSELPLIS